MTSTEKKKRRDLAEAIYPGLVVKLGSGQAALDAAMRAACYYHDHVDDVLGEVSGDDDEDAGESTG